LPRDQDNDQDQDLSGWPGDEDHEFKVRSQDFWPMTQDQQFRNWMSALMTRDLGLEITTLTAFLYPFLYCV